MTIVTVSNWLEDIVNKSFLGNVPVYTIHNGINTTFFSPQQNSKEIKEKYGIGDRFLILGVAGIWTRLKGLDDFHKLSHSLKKDQVIVLIGLNHHQLKNLPDNIIGLSKSENRQELVNLYSAADVFVNPTWEDSFPTTNLESLSCGTPVITYRTGGSVEAVSSETGFIVEKGNISKLSEVINIVEKMGKHSFSVACRRRAIDLYTENDQFYRYLELYKNILI